MKKVLAIVLALALSLALAVPVVAMDGEADPTTGVTVNQGNSDPPIIKAKWEQLDPLVPPYLLEDADPAHSIPLTQLLPPLAYEATIDVQYWAVVTDPNDVSTVEQVWVNVYHPEGPPECGSWKYKKDLDRQEKGEVGSEQAIDAFIAAWEAGLVTFGTDPAGAPYTYEEVRDELIQCEADVYMGVGVLDYHQPWGDYRVVADASDIHNNWASNWGHDLTNLLTYVAVPGIELDFDHVDYGQVDVCHVAWDHGDVFFVPGDGAPTVRNIGNTEVALYIQQDDMGLGYEGTGEPPDVNWNVEFDVRLGEPPNPDILFDPAGVVGDPELPIFDEWTLIEPTLPLCNTEKINFSIHVKQGASGDYRGTMWIGYAIEAFSGECPE